MISRRTLATGLSYTGWPKKATTKLSIYRIKSY